MIYFSYVHSSPCGFDLVLVQLYFGTVRTLASILKFHNNIHEFHAVKVFALVHIKNHVHFNIRTYFFYFIYSLFKTSYIRLSILHYIFLTYHFSLFLKLFLFLTHNNNHSLSFYVFKIQKEKKKKKLNTKWIVSM